MTVKELLQQAMAMHQGGQLDEALLQYRQILEQAPGHVAALANLASIHARQARYPQALDYSQQALQSEAAGPEVWFNYGNPQ